MITIVHTTENSEARFNISDEATGTEALGVFCKAMQLETYSSYVIYKAMLELAAELGDDIEISAEMLAREDNANR